ncbi:MAG: isocitrate/isopropylmalate dehydrogenase family protein [SAR324 cluster bacterium]|nr:isocitrate/isopropylmalate dehydrogenase family protein [SAR324 cluster bacterium]
MSTYQIAFLSGDGIGKEVAEETRRVLEYLQILLPEIKLNFVPYPMGAGEYLKNGNPLPDSTLEGIKKADAILLGAMGLPEVRWSDGTEMVPQIEIREKLDLYAGERPLRLYHESFTPLKGFQNGEIDLLIIRENTEGLFWGRTAGRSEDPDSEEDIMHISRKGAERISRYAFKKAILRPAKKVCLVDKANVLKSSAFFREIFLEVGKQFPEIETECVYVDAFALFLVQRPQTFDVIVTENMFGDILSDLGAGLIGGMGMAPSADIGEQHAVFQPSHGTAPDIAGQGIANPVATILSAAMMMDYLKEPRAASLLISSVEEIFKEGKNTTRDLGGALSTRAFGDKLMQVMKNQFE